MLPKLMDKQMNLLCDSKHTLRLVHQPEDVPQLLLLLLDDRQMLGVEEEKEEDDQQEGDEE